ncbi:mediator of RNA polymerase II transcription subunit 13-like isoform X1 [Eriocheir sinensis]|uniref:mediator of RNA polymerase II transcription subunit 13-like isoform X1 n=1 Tax=Eriocheir sinensis TaxID=95602 RepID=UPI0021C5ECB4|nr:mediator of RNA polymerase II transcription subunit 13-like isoform X1 [Eriocheir sinensis]
MMSTNSQTNGASLEDCHTNFFALTDLCGIKWRVYVWDNPGGSSYVTGGGGGGGGGGLPADPLEDPVLVSYSRMIAADVLCVWRKTWRGPQDVPASPHMTHQQHHHAQHQLRHSLRHSPKELWVFWYGDEPDLTNLLAPELLRCEDIRGAWDWESGLSYECRTLLFKALHNLIERCLLTRDFVRLGRWFVQPYEGPEGVPGSSSTHLSFSLSFFVHGESIVCASVDVRQHPPVRELTRRHLLLAQQSNHGIPVILGPYGLSGTLTGVSYRHSEPSIQKLLDEWRQFFPVETKAPPTESLEPPLPAAVEVIVGGHKMRYPTCYVLVTDMDDYLMAGRGTNVVNVGQAAPSSLKGGLTNETSQEASETSALPANSSPFMASTHTLLASEYLSCGGRGLGWSRGMCERVWQDVVQCPGQLPPTPHDGLTPEGALIPAEIAGQWEFSDPATKISCSCAKCRRGRVSNKGCSSSKGRGEKLGGGGGSGRPRGGGCSLAGCIPFHKRPPTTPLAEADQCGMPAIEDSELLQATARLSGAGTPSGGSGGGGFGGYKSGGVTTPGSVPSLRLTGVNDGPPPSVDSPASITPSPLPTPHSQPSSVPHHDPTMPTLSPHPPPSNTSVGDPPTPAPPDSVDVKPSMSDLIGPKSVSSPNTQGMSPLVGGDRSNGVESSETTSSIGGNGSSNSSGGGGGGGGSGGGGGGGGGTSGGGGGSGSGGGGGGGGSNSNTTTTTTTSTGGPLRGLKRPSLPGTDYHFLLEQEKPSTVLYDYTKLNAWLHHPIKKFKPAEPKVEEPLWPPYRPAHIQEKMEPYRQEVGQEVPEMNGLPLKDLRGIKRPEDPYDFEDDLGSGATLETYKRKDGLDKEEAKTPGSVQSTHDPHSPSQPKKNTGNLYTLAGLQPSLSDLDELFDSDSPVDDGTFPDHTPPGSNKPSGGPEDTAAVLSNKGGGAGNNKSSVSASLVELTKMFPTPPSHEHNPDHDTALEEVISIKTERIEEPRVPQVAEPLGHLAKEEQPPVPAVYRPPSVAMFVGSSKYAPLTNLPSQEHKASPIPEDWLYKPSCSWQFPVTEKPHSTAPPIVHMGPHSGAPSSAPASHSQKAGVSPISPMPPSLGGSTSDGGPGSQRGPGSVGPASAGPPMNYDLTSPASNQSSYLSKAMPSVEPPGPTLGLSQVPEATSLIVNIALQDSNINLFRDHNFDSCTMCVCNNNQRIVGNIRGNDGTLYLPPTQLSMEEESICCNCGFSAVVNRRLAFQAGLFYEDEVDLTGLHEALANECKKQSLHLLTDNKGAENPDREAAAGANAGASSAGPAGPAGGTGPGTVSGPVVSGGGGGGGAGTLDQLPQSLFRLLQSQCLVTLSTPSSVLYRSTTVYQNTRRDILLNIVDYKDGNEIAYLAVEQSRGGGLGGTTEGESGPPGLRLQCMHKWCYYQFNGPRCSRDIVRCMKALQPHLQEAIQKKGRRVNWEPVFSVDGPLTWRQFHRMAVRGTEDMAEPLPIPMLLAGHDRDWLSVAPQSLRHWEKLLLEPYSQQRNVAYVVVAPDNEFILSHVRTFFKELSSIYELCRLGRHSPIQRVLRNGIMRISKTAASKVANEPLEEWFSLLGDSHMSTKLKLYAQVCRHWLAPHLATLNMDKSLFEMHGSSKASERQAPSPMPPPSSENMSTPNPSTTPTQTLEPDNTTSYSSSNSTSSTTTPSSQSGTVLGSGASLNEVDEDDSPPPAILVYLVDPFNVGQDHPDMHRLVTLGLLRCYEHMLEGLPESMQNNVYLQIISLESILELASDSHDRSRHIDQLKSLAFSVFMQCRRTLTHNAAVKSLTGFGPAAVYDAFLKPKEASLAAEEKRLAPYHIFSPAYILAPIKESRGTYKEAQEALGVPREKSTILNCTYCLSEDQRWLLATATDDLGEILETVTINIEIPNRTRRKKASARRQGLKKLMDWILSVMSIGVHPWRLIVGRLGRMGHGELKGWSSLLSRKSLIQASKNLKEMCKQCAYLFPGDSPCILSACLVSMEADSSFRMMPDMFTPDERFGQNSQNCNLSTPEDLTCTHILVFPTSAKTQSAQKMFQDEQTFGNTDLLLGTDLDEDIEVGMDTMAIGLNINELLMLETGPNQDDQLEDGNGHRDSLSQPSSPIMGTGGRTSPSQFSGQARSNGVVLVDPQEDGRGSVLQQPLALGYYVSTASTGRLPRWFWSACPHLEGSCPVFLKSALHLHSPGITQSEEFVHNTNNKVHPLDSSYTTDVLRYVLEGYNGLSWLVLDPAKQDRRSCLPLHMQVLSHLYNVMAALV